MEEGTKPMARAACAGTRPCLRARPAPPPPCHRRTGDPPTRISKAGLRAQTGKSGLRKGGGGDTIDAWQKPNADSAYPSQGATRSMPISSSKLWRGRTTAQSAPLTITSAASGWVL